MLKLKDLFVVTASCYVLLNIGASKIPSKIKFEDIIRIVVDCAFA